MNSHLIKDKMIVGKLAGWSLLSLKKEQNQTPNIQIRWQNESLNSYSWIVDILIFICLYYFINNSKLIKK